MPTPSVQENIYTHFINQVKDYAIFAIDPDGIVTSWNEGAQRIKGYEEDEIVGQYFGMLFPEEARKEGKPENELARAKQDGVFENEDWRLRKDGSLFWAKVTLTAIYSDEGDLIGLTKVTGDLTGRKEWEDCLARKNEELQRINVDLDNFIYTASHDLKAPIANIEGFVKLLAAKYDKKNLHEEEFREFIAYIQDSISRFKTTIGDLTQISRTQRNIAEDTQGEVVNVQAVYDDILADVGFLFSDANCCVTTDFTVPLLVFSRKNFRSILYNLVSNAFKYRSPERDCRILVRTENMGGYILLSVKDNGLGLNGKNKKQLFSMFKRFHSHTEGTGIGLYIVKRIMDNAGGRIEVESTEGEGTEFKVFFKQNTFTHQQEK
jgi:PAS domain S-box-containing protein